MKEASYDLNQILDAIAGAPGGFSVLAGDDSATFAMMAHGAPGMIATVGNLVPDVLAALASALTRRADGKRPIAAPSSFPKTPARRC